MSDEVITNLVIPKALSNLDEEFLVDHNKLQHTLKKKIFSLCYHGHLPRKFLNLEKKTPPFVSCIIGRLQRLVWRNNWLNKSNIRKHTQDKPGKKVSTD